MPRDNAFIDHLLDLLAPLHPVRVRAMFGGYGIYRGEAIFAIVVNDRLYLKADDASRPDFESRNLAPFTYTGRGKLIRLSYYEAPADVFEDPDTLRDWTNRALAAASRATSRRPERRKPNTPKAGASARIR